MKPIVVAVLCFALPVLLLNNELDRSVPQPEIAKQVAGMQPQPGKDICWQGTLNGKTPVIVHYQVKDDIVAGYIIYLNTKNKTPIKLIGSIEEKNYFRLLEFDNTGNITGIITGTPAAKKFSGFWFSPKSRKELSLELTVKDTTILSENISADPKEIFGNYYYQYSDAGSTGGLGITKISNARASFNINAVTSEPARNIADISTDTITLSRNEFQYHVPDTDDCDFRVRFYKGFASVKYTKGDCEGQFGHNATVEGIFLKVK
jgi:hypothetical protein